ncbi:hypothetical protein VULLAG_LOCUS99 [Vulpes lagopus]
MGKEPGGRGHPKSTCNWRTKSVRGQTCNFICLTTGSQLGSVIVYVLRKGRWNLRKLLSGNFLKISQERGTEEHTARVIPRPVEAVAQKGSVASKQLFHG